MRMSQISHSDQTAASGLREVHVRSPTQPCWGGRRNRLSEWSETYVLQLLWLWSVAFAANLRLRMVHVIGEQALQVWWALDSEGSKGSDSISWSLGPVGQLQGPKSEGYIWHCGVRHIRNMYTNLVHKRVHGPTGGSGMDYTLPYPSVLFLSTWSVTSCSRYLWNTSHFSRWGTFQLCNSVWAHNFWAIWILLIRLLKDLLIYSHSSATLAIFTLVVSFTVTSNPATWSWALGCSLMWSFSLILAYQKSIGIPIPTCISPTRQTLASLAQQLLPPLTATWAWSSDSEMTWSHSPMFSFIFFVVVYLGKTLNLDHSTSSDTNKSQATCAVVFWLNLLLFSNTVVPLVSKRFWTTSISVIFSRVCHRRRVWRML